MVSLITSLVAYPLGNFMHIKTSRQIKDMVILYVDCAPMRRPVDKLSVVMVYPSSVCSG